MKRAIEITEKYERATATTLADVYDRWSKAKEAAYNYCKRLMYNYKGHGLKILSANTFRFTAGFEFEDEKTGLVCIMYITPTKNEIVEWTR